MSLVKWEPLQEFENIFDRYARAFRRSADDNPIAIREWSPRVDITETQTDLVVKAEIPDVSKEDIKVSVSQGVLTIEGEKKQETEQKNLKQHRIERHYGVFSRSFILPPNLDETKINASFKNGVLNLHIPKIPNSMLKGIEVKIN